MKIQSVRVLVCLIVLGGCASPEDSEPPPRAPRSSALVPARFVDTKLVEGLDSPTTMAFAPDGRLFVCEQSGRLRIIENGVLRSEPFLTVTTDDTGERGLLGLAFDPDFPAQPYLYVYYTVRTPTVHNRLSRFTANGNRAVAGSERVLLELETLTSANHNGGALHFGRDGKLYVAVGENTRSADAQTLSSLRGKLLRLNKDGSIPSDNPFYTTATGDRRAIWALGLRNPFSFAVQPGTGRLFINDVGANQWEEVDEGVAGANYGWPTVEGPENDSRFREPLHSYPHGTGNDRGCAITGGTFYNPAQPRFPAEYVGKYFFADFCGAWIRTVDPITGVSALFASDLGAPVDLDVGPDGHLYYLDRGEDAVRRISYAANEVPSVLQQPASQHVAVGQPVTFSVSAGGTAPLRYQWQRNGANLSGATSAGLTLPSVTAGDSGARFRVRVSNDAGSVMSAEAVLTVETGNTAPVATITSPSASLLYRAGDVIAFRGTGTDAEDGTLPASAFTWRVDFHHDEHLHPFFPARSGVTSGTFTCPLARETSANVWYRIHLEVTDSRGAKHAVFRDVRPRTAQLGLATEPTGLQVTLDGQPHAAPYAVSAAAGMVRMLGVVSPQVKDGKRYVFERWSNGGAATHDVRMPDADTRYTAVFKLEATEPPPGPGTGLRAEYFGAADLTGPRLTRVDPTVDFRWKSGSPAAEVNLDAFSARWTGSVVPKYSETYTFHTDTNDGVRLWVNGQLLIDDWKRQDSSVDNLGTITLEAGRAYSLRMEFFEQKGWATARLLWSSPRQRKQVIPAAQLRPAPPEVR